MKGWLKAAAIAAVTAWLLMGGLDYLETHYYAMKWVQMDMVDQHDRFMQAMKGGK